MSVRGTLPGPGYTYLIALKIVRHPDMYNVAATKVLTYVCIMHYDSDYDSQTRTQSSWDL